MYNNKAFELLIKRYPEWKTCQIIFRWPGENWCVELYLIHDWLELLCRFPCTIWAWLMHRCFPFLCQIVLGCISWSFKTLNAKDFAVVLQPQQRLYKHNLTPTSSMNKNEWVQSPMDEAMSLLTSQRPYESMNRENDIAVPVMACVDGMLYSEL